MNYLIELNAVLDYMDSQIEYHLQHCRALRYDDPERSIHHYEVSNKLKFMKEQFMNEQLFPRY